MHKHKTIGNEGEAVVQGYFEQRGYCLLHRQWRQRGGEIDLIMRRDDEVLFVEVKTRRAGNQSSSPHDIHPAQVRRQAGLIESYVTRNGVEQWRWILACVTRARPPHLELIELTETAEMG